jgi:hypothetical protein
MTDVPLEELQACVKVNTGYDLTLVVKPFETLSREGFVAEAKDDGTMLAGTVWKVAEGRMPASLRADRRRSANLEVSLVGGVRFIPLS